MKKLLFRTSGKEAMFLGVCGGLGKYLTIDPTIVRIALAIFTFFSLGLLPIIYFIVAFIVPKEPEV